MKLYMKILKLFYIILNNCNCNYIFALLYIYICIYACNMIYIICLPHNTFNHLRILYLAKKLPPFLADFPGQESGNGGSPSHHGCFSTKLL